MLSFPALGPNGGVHVITRWLMATLGAHSSCATVGKQAIAPAGMLLLERKQAVYPARGHEGWKKVISPVKGFSRLMRAFARIQALPQQAQPTITVLL